MMIFLKNIFANDYYGDADENIFIILYQFYEEDAWYGRVSL